MRHTPPITRVRQAPEAFLETALFSSRWLLAPFYVGLVIALGALLYVFVKELFAELSHLTSMRPQDAILMALSLIDLSLAGNLLLIVTFSGYENFVSRIDTHGHEDRPSWMGTVDFSGLKMKLIASIVAISAIALLRAFMEINDKPFDPVKLGWMLGIHLSFIVSGILLALMDFLNAHTEALQERQHLHPPTP